jgi:chromosome segregation ATPase
VVQSSSHSFSPLQSSFAEINSTETSLDASTLPAPRSDNTNEEDQVMRTEVEKQALALREAIEENAPLKQSLYDLEQLIKRLDEENVTKSAALLSYDEPKMVEFEKKIEDQKEHLKRKTEEYNALDQKNQQKLDTLKQNNQALKTRWEESVQRVADLKEKTLKPTEDEIEELTRQLSECEKEIKSIDRETQKRAIEHSNQFQIVRSRSASKKPNLIPSTSNSRGTSNDPAHKEASKNRRQSKWRSMDDFKSINPSPVRRNHSTHPPKPVALGKCDSHHSFNFFFFTKMQIHGHAIWTYPAQVTFEQNG